MKPSTPKTAHSATKTAHSVGMRGTSVTAKLDEWLEKIEAYCLWQKRLDSGDTVEGWAYAGNVMIVVRYRKEMGWNVYTSLNTNDIEATLADAEKRLRG